MSYSVVDPNLVGSGRAGFGGAVGLRISGPFDAFLTGTPGDEGDGDYYGGSGDDELRGGEDNDGLLGGSGTDYLAGGIGHDALNGADGSNVITDFENGVDRIDVSGFGPGSAFVATANGSDVELRSGGELLATIENFSVAQIDTSDFIFT